MYNHNPDDLIELRVIHDELLLADILDLALGVSPALYIQLFFMAYGGLRQQEIIELTADEVKGTSFFVKKYKRLLIYPKLFCDCLNDYIKFNNLKGHWLFPKKLNNLDEHVGQGKVARDTAQFLKNIGYKGSSITFIKTFFYMYAKNYGSLEQLTKKAWERKWIESTLDISFEEYKSFALNRVSNSNQIEAVPELAIQYFKELDKYYKKANGMMANKDIQDQLTDIYRTIFKNSFIENVF